MQEVTVIVDSDGGDCTAAIERAVADAVDAEAIVVGPDRTVELDQVISVLA